MTVGPGVEVPSYESGSLFLLAGRYDMGVDLASGVGNIDMAVISTVDRAVASDACSVSGDADVSPDVPISSRDGAKR